MNNVIVSAESSSSLWDIVTTPTQHVVGILSVTFILVAMSIVYFVKARKLQPTDAPKGYVLIIDIYVGYIRKLMAESLGPKFEKMTPYFIYLFSYILLSNLIDIVGFENPTNSLTVTLSLGLVTWIGIFVVGFKFQKIAFMQKFFFSIKVKGHKVPVMVNPLGVIEMVTPLISISFRLWGNIFAGATIVGLWFFFTGYFVQSVPVLNMVNIIGGITIIPIYAFFDLLSGSIQALVFVLLTMNYWGMEASHGHVEEKKEVKYKIQNIKNK